jgi:beta-lactamase superfamily II metal-dependent hydrolase
VASLTLKAIKAKHGDSLILTASGTTVLIDGGPPGVYNRFLKKHLQELDSDAEDPPKIDLMMISHVDSDHIAGILDLTNDLIEMEEAEARPLVTIRRAWFNSFADTIATSGVETPRSARGAAASLASVYEEEALIFADKDRDSAKLVLESVSQGRNLRRDLKTLSIDINGRFKDRLALREGNVNPWKKGQLELTVIGPTQAEIDKLKKEWAKQLPKILDKEAKKKARLEAAASLDTSVFNLASIVVIAESAGKKMLLTGDARGDMILGWLKAAGWEDGRAHFDIVKLPHHGSDRNVTPEFFKKVTADSYVVCGDGKHGNPEPAMFEMLFQARPDDEYQVFMTYSPDELAGHRDFIEDERANKLKAVLAAAPNRFKLSFPGPGETSITVSV